MYSTEEFTQLVINAVIKDKAYIPELEAAAAERMLEGINNSTRALWALEDLARIISEIYAVVDDELVQEHDDRLAMKNKYQEEWNHEYRGEWARGLAEDAAKYLSVKTSERSRKQFIKEMTDRFMKSDVAIADMLKLIDDAKATGIPFHIEFYGYAEEEDPRASAETKLDQMLEWAKKSGGSYDIFSDGDTIDIAPVTPREVKWLKDFEDGVREDLAKAKVDEEGEPYTKYHDTEEEFEDCYFCSDNDRPYWK